MRDLVGWRMATSPADGLLGASRRVFFRAPCQFDLDFHSGAVLGPLHVDLTCERVRHGDLLGFFAVAKADVRRRLHLRGDAAQFGGELRARVNGRSSLYSLFDIMASLKVKQSHPLLARIAEMYEPATARL